MKDRLVRLLIAIFLPTIALCQGDPGFNGKWTAIPQISHDISLYGALLIDIQQQPGSVIVVQKWGTGRSFTDSMKLKLGGAVNTVTITERVWPANVFMGLAMPIGGKRLIKAVWQNEGKMLQLQESYSVRGSQGLSPIMCTHTYELSDDKEILTYTVLRSSRPTGPPV